jgi:8-amino-7-oxononanoate synthase
MATPCLSESFGSIGMSLGWLPSALSSLEQDGRLRRRRCVRAETGGRCTIDGRPLLNFAGNDYLDLAGDARLADAARDALAAGAGARASALVTGRSPWHVRLEERLARFEDAEAAILFPTGYAANVGTVAALVGPGDLVLGDRLNHASLVDGCRLSGATFRPYAHCNPGALDRELKKHAAARRKLIATDAVFSMDGDMAPLPELLEVARNHQAMLLVDEAHATGVWGTRGAGVCELQGVHSDGVIRVGTLSKAVGAQGGFVAGPQMLIDWLWNRARTQAFSTALAPALCAAACAAIDIIEAEPERRAELLARCAGFRAALAERDVPFSAGSCGPIVPIVLGDEQRVMRVAATLEARGFLAGAIRPPTVPHRTARLRISITAAHDDAMLSALARGIAESVHESR